MNDKKLVIIVNEDETKEVKVYQTKEQYKKMKKRIIELYDQCSFYEVKEKNEVKLESKESIERCAWYEDEYCAGYYDDDGHLCVCFEFGSDEMFDTHANDVANGYGYYDENGKYVSYGLGAI